MLHQMGVSKFQKRYVAYIIPVAEKKGLIFYMLSRFLVPELGYLAGVITKLQNRRIFQFLFEKQ